ncbi:hypothetical protein HWX16_20815 [Ochrobactrum intermedium]|uniref:hypothetical protein n=1 Tax=Brucella intermedia TaxID=94625 RepID=UPI00159C642C|nr:hypothetical protein [Brucella intermedia]NVM42759.1 hypothetical protein [Brucella intermedia]UXO85473.1 hypothetical protein N8I72_13950 [Brucella intermedia]
MSSTVLRQPTTDMMIEVDPHQYVNWLSAMQNGLIVRNDLSSKRQYQRREIGTERTSSDVRETKLAESREGAIFDRAATPINIFAAPAGPVQNPYRTKTRWLRDQSGALVRDEHGLPMPEPRKVTRRSSVTDSRRADWMKRIEGTDNTYKVAKTWTEGKMKQENTPAERALMHAMAEHARVASDGQIIAAVERINQRHTELVESAANDNLQGWELLRQLRREKRHDDVEAVELYRGLCSLIASQPLRGFDYGYDKSMEKEYRSLKLEGENEVDEAASKGWQDNTVPGGEIEYKEVRKRSNSDLGWTHPPKKYAVADDNTKVKARPFAVKFNENVMIAKIDMRPVLEELRTALGVGLAPFEDAVLGGKTLTEIGEARGFKGVQASAAGKALINAAINGLRETWDKIKRRQRKEARRAIMNVDRARARLERQKVRQAA